MSHPFFSIHTHGLLRVAVAAPSVRVADPAFNVARTIEMARDADARGASLVAVSRTRHQLLCNRRSLASERAVRRDRDGDRRIAGGEPASFADRRRRRAARHRGRLYNCALADKARPNSGGLAEDLSSELSRILRAAPFRLRRLRCRRGNRRSPAKARLSARDVLLEASDFAGLVDSCRNLRGRVGSNSALRARRARRRDRAAQSLREQRHRRQIGLSRTRSARRIPVRCLAAYLYSAAGQGESTTDLAWDGEATIFENGALLAKAPRFAEEPQLVVADIDIGRLRLGAHAPRHLRRLRRS